MAWNLQNHVHLAVLLLICLCGSGARSRLLEVNSLAKRHEAWMTRYGRVYKDNVEKKMRFRVFEKNVKFIDSINHAANKSYKLAVNQFADLTDEEFRATHTGFKAPSGHKIKPTESGVAAGFMYENATRVPDSVDWRLEGAVNPIKNQEECGCCWAFSAVAAVEGITKISTGQLLSLSEQELIDCDKYGINAGCNGGSMDEAFGFIVGSGGITSEANYPYQYYDEGICRVQSLVNVAKITNFEDVPTNSEAALLQAVAHQPVSAAIAASDMPEFRFYSSGVFTGGCGDHLDHGVVVVGYGMDPCGTKYWLVRNSWGTDWGEGGYIRIERDIGDPVGRCGIAMKASYPIA